MRVRVVMLIGLLIAPLGWKARLSDVAGYLWPSARDVNQRKQSFSEQFRWQGKIATEQVVEIQGLNGDIYAELSTGGEVEVTAVKNWTPRLEQEIEIKVAKRENGVLIRAIASDHCEEAQRLRGNATDKACGVDSVGVHFTVRIPWGVRLIAHTVNGDIIAASLGGPVEAEAINGNVHLSTSAYGQARAVNGSITASLGTTSGKQSLIFETRHGDIALHLPAVADSDISTKSLRGRISSQFPLKQKCTSGRPELKVSTVEGRIGLYRHAQYVALLEELGWISTGKDSVSAGREPTPMALRVGICGLRIGQAGSVALAP